MRYTLRRACLALSLLVLATSLRLTIATQDGQGNCPELLLPHNTEYRKLCENTSPGFDLHWRCFTHVDGNFHRTKITSHKAEKGKPILFAKDGDFTDFTLSNQLWDFSIEYPYAGITLHYESYPDMLPCSVVTLETWNRKFGYIMVIREQDSEEFVADTRRSNNSRGVVCTKWARIGLVQYH
ncbi:uncharacterized protein UTRI_03998 [Ustilago trichophora]|uniref:Mig1 protein n=1 Tax=Ustilago trichophora TaxID=86804 RepID=A0A5C3EB44_9BASI|nr:uncharacterized protein UTRI_03998 [Ustilago trichophora]